MKSFKRKTEYGFTLIEMIVSLALFSVVVTVSVGALLMLIGTNEQLQGEQSVMTNLSFALDSMTREIRTGSKYFCDSRQNKNAGPQGDRIFEDGRILDADSIQDCENGNETNRPFHGMSFIEAGQSITEAADTRIVYFFDSAEGKIYRRISGQAAESIVSSGIRIQEAEFFVTGGESVEASGGTNTVQPSVTIHIRATDENDTSPDAASYFVQTTVTQRTLDI